MKTCPRCGVEKPLDGFYRSKRYKDGRQIWCKACKLEHQQSAGQRAQQKSHYDANRDEQIAKAQDWAEKNRLKSRAIKTKWRLKNPEKQKAAIADWESRNPDKRPQYNETRRARKYTDETDFTRAQWREILATYNYHCAYCLKPESQVGRLEQDHMLPLSRGGAHTSSNIAPACRSCNAQKSDKTVLEFMQYAVLRDALVAAS